jgi:hypothetical protein
MDKILVACGTLLVLLPASPLYQPLTFRDSGVFLYIGWRILNGEVPYRGIWDHKPPVIFYINAIGLAIANNSRWGVWFLEFVSLFLAALIGYHLIKKVLGVYPAIYSLLLGLITLVFVLQGGNFTEEYALPLQFLALWLIIDVDNSPSSLWRFFMIGLIGGIAFFTKQTAIGIWIAIILYITIIRLKRNQIKRWLMEISSIIGGGSLICIVITIYFISQGALADFWSAAFKYNFDYSTANTGLVFRLKPILTGITPLATVGLFQFALIGYGIGLLLILFRKDLTSNWMSLLLVGLIDLPLELILVSASGYRYAHYYITIIPILTVFSGLTFWVLLTQLASWKFPSFAKSIFQVSIIVIFMWSSYIPYRIARNYTWNTDDSVIKYIESHTSPNDSVLLWGADAMTNFYSYRKSPTRFVYQYPLYLKSYADEKLVLEFLEGIIQNRPSLIIDTVNPDTPIYDFPIQTEKIREYVDYLRSHYRIVDNIEGWYIYGYFESENAP